MQGTANHLQTLQFALDSFYILMSGLLLMWMVAGLTLFEAGMIRSRNTTDILLKNISVFAVACIVYLFISYHVMFSVGSGAGKYFPDFHMISAMDAFPQVLHAKHYGYLVGVFFQVMLAVITVSIISGATAERLKLWPFLFFAIIMIGIIYPLEGYWVWGKGFLHQLGFIDIAGAGVVHLAGACAALPCVLMLGARSGKFRSKECPLPMPGSNMPLATCGVLMVWIGCFGFNGGSGVAFSQGDFANTMGAIFLNTLVAGSAGLLTAMIVSQIFRGVVDLTIVFNGAVVGLISVAASPATFNIGETMLVASIASILMTVCLSIFDKCKIDDPVGAVVVHGVGGIVALVAATSSQNYAALSQQRNMPWHWHQQLGVQCFGILVIALWVTVASTLAWLLIRLIMGLRIKPIDEYKGLDVMGCGMMAYPEFTDSGWEE